MMPPNGLPISRCERATQTAKIRTISREAVGCIPPSRRAVTPHQMTGRYPIRFRMRRRPVITIPPSRRAVTPHQMTGRYPIRFRMRRRPVITMGVLACAVVEVINCPDSWVISSHAPFMATKGVAGDQEELFALRVLRPCRCSERPRAALPLVPTLHS